MFSLTKSITVSLLLLIGLYLGISSILAIPLIDEDKTKTKELSISLRDELNTIKTSFLTHILDLKYDTLTLQKFDELNQILRYNNNASSLNTNLGNRILNQRIILENHTDVIYYTFLNADLVGLNAKKKYKNLLLKNYKDLCSEAEIRLFLDVMGVRVNVLNLYTITKEDSLKGKKEYAKLVDQLNRAPITPDSAKISSLENPFLRFFFLSNAVVKDESQTLAVILGLIGLGLLGAVIGTFSRFNSESNATQKAEIVNSLFSTIIKSFSASVVSYLSIKGGLSIISDNNDTNPNSYFILFICFIASVFSEEIWQWAKTKILPS